MRKGDEKRQEMLAVAERLFCLKGYEATSVQDIVSVLHISKGGFYHHFSSKEELLNTLFYQRAERALEKLESELSAQTDVMTRLNMLFYAYIPLRSAEAEFLAMLLPVLDRPEGRALRLCYQEALVATFLPALRRELALALDTDTICPACHELEDVVLNMIGQCWVDIAALLNESVKKAQKSEAFALSGILNKYRRAVERLLDAPFGSVELISLQEWDSVCEELTRRMLTPMRG